MDLYIILKNRAVFVFLLISLVSAFSGCADKKDSASSCLVQLDEEKYKSVAENSGCSNSQRASGYLGLAGMTIPNFLTEGATDNFTKTLNITSIDNASDFYTGKRGFYTNALCLVGSDNITASDRCTNNSVRRQEGRNCKDKKRVAECELSMFGNIGDLIYTTFATLDNNSDGMLVENEINPTDTNNFSNNGDASSLTVDSRYEMVINETTYVADNTSCSVYTDNFTFSPNGGLAYCSNIYLLLPGTVSNISAIRPIVKLDNMTDFFGSMDLPKVLGTVNNISSTAFQLNYDFDSVGLDNESDFRKELTKTISMFDNGAKAKNNNTCIQLSQLNAVFLLVSNPADNSTNSTDLKSKNLVSLTDLSSSIDSGLEDDLVVPSGFPSIENVRLIYKKNNGNYTDSYEAAHNYLYNSVKNLRNISSTTSTKNDGAITFQELICYPEN